MAPSDLIRSFRCWKGDSVRGSVGRDWKKLPDLPGTFVYLLCLPVCLSLSLFGCLAPSVIHFMYIYIGKSGRALTGRSLSPCIVHGAHVLVLYTAVSVFRIRRYGHGNVLIHRFTMLASIHKYRDNCIYAVEGSRSWRMRRVYRKCS